MRSLSSESLEEKWHFTREGVDNDTENDIQGDDVEHEVKRRLKEELEHEPPLVAGLIGLRHHRFADAAAVSEPLGIRKENLRN